MWQVYRDSYWSMIESWFSNMYMHSLGPRLSLLTFLRGESLGPVVVHAVLPPSKLLSLSMGICTDCMSYSVPVVTIRRNWCSLLINYCHQTLSMGICTDSYSVPVVTIRRNWCSLLINYCHQTLSMGICTDSYSVPVVTIRRNWCSLLINYCHQTLSLGICTDSYICCIH